MTPALENQGEDSAQGILSEILNLEHLLSQPLLVSLSAYGQPSSIDVVWIYRVSQFNRRWGLSFCFSLSLLLVIYEVREVAASTCGILDREVLTMLWWEGENAVQTLSTWDGVRIPWTELQSGGAGGCPGQWFSASFPDRARHDLCGSTWEQTHITAHTCTAPTQRLWPHATLTPRGS